MSGEYCSRTGSGRHRGVLRDNSRGARACLSHAPIGINKQHVTVVVVDQLKMVRSKSTNPQRTARRWRIIDEFFHCKQCRRHVHRRLRQITPLTANHLLAYVCIRCRRLTKNAAPQHSAGNAVAVIAD